MIDLEKLGLEKVLEILDLENSDFELIGRIHQLGNDPNVTKVMVRGSVNIVDYNVMTRDNLSPSQAQKLLEYWEFPEPALVDPSDDTYHATKEGNLVSEAEQELKQLYKDGTR